MGDYSNIRDKALAYYVGYSTDKEIRHKASSGGVGTAIIKYLFSLPEYSTSITFVYDKEKCGYILKLIHSFDEFNICGSIYQDIDIFSFIKNNLSNIKDGIVLSCMPCQVRGIRSILNKNNNRNFILSFCCSGQTTERVHGFVIDIWELIKNKVENMQYRGNGWPSGMQIRLSNGETIYKDNYTNPWKLMHQSKLFRPKRCLMCKEDISYKADISLADPLAREIQRKNDRIGNTMF